MKIIFEDLHYSEGDEETGFARLKDILDAVEEIVNLDDIKRKRVSNDRPR